MQHGEFVDRSELKLNLKDDASGNSIGRIQVHLVEFPEVLGDTSAATAATSMAYGDVAYGYYLV